MAQGELNGFAEGMYQRINQAWQEEKESLFKGACGFSILSGPPIYRPSLMIIGENPGFGKDDHEPHIDASWPEESCLAGADWTMARKLRNIFEEAGLPRLLENTIQTNFLFFKSSSISRPSRYRWVALQRPVREKVQAYCWGELHEFIRLSEPQMIMVLGMAAFTGHASDVSCALLDRKEKRWLLATGVIAGAPAFGVLHPTGARVAKEDWSRVATWLRENLRAHLLQRGRERKDVAGLL